MDFFDSAVDEINESDVYNESLTAGLAAPILIATAFTVGIEGYLRLEHSKALKNYERANPDLIPFRKLRKVTESLSEVSEGGAVKKELNPLSGFIQKLASQVGASKKELLEVFMNGDDCVFIIRTIGPKQVKMYAGNCPKKHHMYYFASWANKSGVYSDELTKWFKKWTAPNNKNGDEQGGENKKMDKVKKESVDDFFDSMTASLIGSGNQDKDFFESTVDDIIGDDSEVVTEAVTEVLIGIIAVIAGAAAVSVAMTTPIDFAKTVVALKNYEKANPDVIPLGKLKRKAFSLNGFEKEAEKKNISKVRAFVKSNITYGRTIDAYVTKDTGEVIIAFQKDSERGRDIRHKTLRVYQASSIAEKHQNYYLAAYALRNRMFSNSTINGWSRKWAAMGDKKPDDSTAMSAGIQKSWLDTKKESVDDIETESFGEFLDINDDIVFESASDKALKAASKQLKKSIKSHDGSIYNKGLNFLGRVKAEIETTDLGKLSKAFESMMSDIEGKVIPRLKDSEHDASELSKELSSIIEDFNSSVEKLKKDEKYSTDKLVSEVKRVNSVVISSAKKTDRFVSDFKSDSAEDIRLVVRIAQTVSSKASVAFSKVDAAVKMLSNEYARQAGKYMYGGTAAGNAEAQAHRDSENAHRQFVQSSDEANRMVQQQAEMTQQMLNQNHMNNMMMGF